MVVQVDAGALTWAQVLNALNTILLIVASFLAREAWKAIHERIEKLEDRHGDMRERVAIVEESTRGWSQTNNPQRRKSDREE